MSSTTRPVLARAGLRLWSRPFSGRLNFVSKSSLFRGDSGLSIVLVFVAFLGAAHVLIRTAIYGIVQSGDALVYMRFAESLAAGDGFEGKLIQWPPLLSAVLGFFRLFGVEPSETGRYLNAISFGLIIIVAGHWMHRYVRYRLVVIGATATMMISYPLPRISSHVLTETLFILVALLALVQMESFLSGRTATTGFLLSIVFSALAPLTRWLGVTVIFTGVILILTCRRYSARVRWKQAAIYGTASLLPLSLWLARNRVVSGTLTGPRRDMGSDQSFWDTLSQLGEVLHWWVFVRQQPGWLGICLWAAAALIVLETVRSFISRRTTIIARRKIGGLDELRKRPTPILAVFATVYLIITIAILPYTTIEGMNNRYLSPVYVPALMTAAIWLDRLLFTTYKNSGVSVWKNPDGWGIHYNRSSGHLAATKWAFICLIFGVVLANNVRNIVLYIDVLITYDPLMYQF